MAVLICICDVAFNYLFIYVLKMGVVGAAMGTALAYICISLPNLYLSACKNKILNLRQDRVRFQWVPEYVHNASKISIPIAIQNILMSGAQIVSTMIVAPLGNIAIAAHSFAITAESLCYMPGYGIGDGASTLVGQTHGAGRVDLCKNFAYMTVGLGMAVMAVMGAVMYVFAPEMIGVLSPVESIRELGTTCLRIEAFAEPFFAASIVTYSVCVGAGDTKKLLPLIWVRCGACVSPWLMPFQELWLGGRVDSDGNGAYFPRCSLPHSIAQRVVDEELPSN